MAGNVAEWTAGWYRPYAKGKATNPTGPGIGSKKGVRGGSWRDDTGKLRSAAREKTGPDEKSETIGFRCAADVK